MVCNNSSSHHERISHRNIKIQLKRTNSEGKTKNLLELHPTKPYNDSMNGNRSLNLDHHTLQIRHMTIMNLIVSGTPNNMIFSILILAFWLYMFVLLIVPIGFLQLGACGCIPPENIYIYIHIYIYQIQHGAPYTRR
jgi:hypothetical protein